MPVHPLPELRLPRPDGRARLRTMPGTDVPVICQPFEAGDALPYWALGPTPSRSHLFDTDVDPGESEDRAGDPVERSLLDGLAGELRAIGAPDDLLVRLRIA